MTRTKTLFESQQYGARQVMIDLLPTRTCFVCHYDMLGFSAILKSDLNRAWPLLCDFERLKSDPTNHHFEFDRTKIEAEIVFSDLIVFFSVDESDESLRAIAMRALEVFAAAYLSGIPLRGAITHGELVFSREPQLFTGPAFLAAHCLGESQQFLGVSLDAETGRRLVACCAPQNEHRLVFEWDVPLKQGSESRYVLNWPIACDSSQRPSCDTPPETLQGWFTGFGNVVDLPEDAKIKYVNTSKFLTAIESHLQNFALCHDGERNRKTRVPLKSPTTTERPR